uniref:Uncharacterized protein n=1 Tax=Anguilla anguilla TaxID=7936 RepID=A0A0E9WKS6_ANGAN
MHTLAMEGRLNSTAQSHPALYIFTKEYRDKCLKSEALRAVATVLSVNASSLVIF